MITGVVRRREAVIVLALRGPRRRPLEINAVVDTGYTGWLTLPPALIAAVGLRWYSFGRGVMADGSINFHDVYVGKVIWDGRERRVRVNELDGDPLVGMALLRGYDVRLQVRGRGRVTIKKLPRPRRREQ